MTQDARAFNWDSIPTNTAVTANPAAGAASQTLFTVGAGKKRMLVGIYFGYQADGTAANRYMQLELTDGTGAIGGACSTALTAGNLGNYSFSVGIGESTSISVTGLSIEFFVPLPVLEIPATGVATIYFRNKQAADDCGVIRYAYKEVPT